VSIGVKVVIGMMSLYLVSGLFAAITGLTSSVTEVSSVLSLLCIATGLTGSVCFLVSRRAQLFRRCALAALLFPALLYVTPEFSLAFPSRIPISFQLVSTWRITRHGVVETSRQEGVELVPLILLCAAWAVSKDYALLERRRKRQHIESDPIFMPRSVPQGQGNSIASFRDLDDGVGSLVLFGLPHSASDPAP